MTPPNEKLLRELGPDTQVLVWMGLGPLNEDTPNFGSMDYLLDGLLRGHLRSSQNEMNQVFFAHELFGQTFWLAYTDVTSAPNEFVTAAKKLWGEKAKSLKAISCGEAAEGAWNKALQGLFGEWRSFN